MHSKLFGFRLFLFACALVVLFGCSKKQSLETEANGEDSTVEKSHKILFDRYYPETGFRITGKFDLTEVTSPPQVSTLVRELVYDGTAIEDYVKKLRYFYDDNIGKDYIDVTPENEKDLPYISPEYLVDIDLNIPLWSREGNYLTMLRNGYWYTGGAHGLSDNTYYVIDIQQKKLLDVADVVRQSSRAAKQLTRALKTALQEKYGKDFLQNASLENLYPPEFFKFDYDGLNFLWTQYRIASGADGPIDVTLPYGKVEKYLTPKGADILTAQQKHAAELE
jgi:hypothetical protein